MKKILLLISAIVFTVSCQNDDDDFYISSTSEAKHEKVFERGNFESDHYQQQTYMVEKGKDSIPDKDLLPWKGNSNPVDLNNSKKGDLESEYYLQQTYMFEKGKDSIPDKDLLPWKGTPNPGNSFNGN